jgi:hypothetical protein
MKVSYPDFTYLLPLLGVTQRGARATHTQHIFMG